MFWFNNIFPTNILIYCGRFFQNHVSQIQRWFFLLLHLKPVKIGLILQHVLPF